MPKGHHQNNPYTILNHTLHTGTPPKMNMEPKVVVCICFSFSAKWYFQVQNVNFSGGRFLWLFACAQEVDVQHPRGLDFLVAALDVVLNYSWRMASCQLFFEGSLKKVVGIGDILSPNWHTIDLDWLDFDEFVVRNMFEMNFFTNSLIQDHWKNVCKMRLYWIPPDNMSGLVHCWFIPIESAYDGS